VNPPETVYAKTSGGWIGYQVVGAGPPDVLAVKPAFLPVDLMWDEPRFVRFLNGLSSFCRHIWFDPRGVGSSDPIAPVEGRLNESVVDDMVAVLDELGCERVVVLDAVGPVALQFAASHPERTSALVLINPTTRVRRANDYPGPPDEDIEALLAMVQHRWGTGEALSLWAPSMASDARFAGWFARCERVSMSPRDADWVTRASFELDVRHLLGAVRVPTLVAARAGRYGSEQSRYVAEHIDGARYVELPGEDFLFFVGDTGPLLDTIEEFVTGRLPDHEVDRVLATVMFTDVVGSSEQAAGMGDRRWSELLATHDGTAPNSDGSAVERSGRLATGSWRPLTGRDELCAAPVPSATRSERSASTCGLGSTPVRLSCTVTRSAASPSTSPNASKRSPGPTKSSSPAPS
jgi:pimeloyl-ACP methyl ester carboxylesterase